MASNKRHSFNVWQSPMASPPQSPAAQFPRAPKRTRSRRVRDSALLMDSAGHTHLKLLLVGDANVGKTAMILRYCDLLPMKDPVDGAPQEAALDTRTTIGVDIKNRLIDIDHRFFNCLIWDTAGQERFRNAIIPSLYRNCHGVVLCYDTCRRSTLDSCLEYWIPEALKNLTSADLKRARFYLIGTKLDLDDDREVTAEDVADFVARSRMEYNVPIESHFAVTSRWSDSVERAFDAVITNLVENGCYDDDDGEEARKRRSRYSSSDLEMASDTVDSTVDDEQDYSKKEEEEADWRDYDHVFKLRIRGTKRNIKTSSVDITKPSPDESSASQQPYPGTYCCT
ncbi:Rab family GTPase YPT11 KNAG_0K02400 [Huiozyma naganishii CBS 8797]|uniref:GTP-binding protein n=1 Tax=Huiozyma naganishii (strain ATCC MYA-139 / BCRC 22969 / CBS 8797 / KCTC 17520 / NBRC 10181 / NCYC 3082 / Yp74L-3) TaxID=1071383 RepID=J7RRV2_HUIN7|nr:hypothetical protein KNAG_0K02400 [Kazachstania naganishii CBS 8797]CCK72603.1 hypothetical protein KNAG_0K02400 [Kazachstania naganishii CBS 8797]